MQTCDLRLPVNYSDEDIEQIGGIVMQALDLSVQSTAA